MFETKNKKTKEQGTELIHASDKVLNRSNDGLSRFGSSHVVANTHQKQRFGPSLDCLRQMNVHLVAVKVRSITAKKTFCSKNSFFPLSLFLELTANTRIR